MSSLHPARRSAERFNSLLEGERGDLTVRDAHEAELFELVGALQTLPRAEARPAFVADLREALMLAAETELLPSDSAAAVDDRLTVTTRRTPRERRIAVALGGFAIISATTSMAVAAQTALPGDVLYPLKRAMENAETGFSVSDEAKGNTILENASGRLDEVDALTREPGADASTVSETLQTFAEQATDASDLLIADYEATGSEDSINDLRDFASTSIEALATLESIIPAGAADALQAAAQVLFQIDSLAANLCPVCENLGISEIPVALLAGGGDVLDDAAAELGAAQQDSKPAKPAKGTKTPTFDNGDQPDATVDNPLEQPTQAVETDDGDDVQHVDTPQNPVKSGEVKIPTAVPSLGLPAVDQVVSDVVKGVDGLLGGKAK